MTATEDERNEGSCACIETPAICPAAPVVRPTCVQQPFAPPALRVYGAVPTAPRLYGAGIVGCDVWFFILMIVVMFLLCWLISRLGVYKWMSDAVSRHWHKDKSPDIPDSSA